MNFLHHGFLNTKGPQFAFLSWLFSELCNVNQPPQIEAQKKKIREAQHVVSNKVENSSEMTETLCNDGSLRIHVSQQTS